MYAKITWTTNLTNVEKFIIHVIEGDNTTNSKTLDGNEEDVLIRIDNPGMSYDVEVIAIDYCLRKYSSETQTVCPRDVESSNTIGSSFSNSTDGGMLTDDTTQHSVTYPSHVLPTTPFSSPALESGTPTPTPSGGASPTTPSLLGITVMIILTLA